MAARTDDVQLLRRLADRDPGAAAEAIRRYGALVHGVALRRTGSVESASTLTSAVIGELFADPTAASSPLAAWLHRTTCARSAAGTDLAGRLDAAIDAVPGRDRLADWLAGPAADMSAADPDLLALAERLDVQPTAIVEVDHHPAMPAATTERLARLALGYVQRTAVTPVDRHLRRILLILAALVVGSLLLVLVVYGYGRSRQAAAADRSGAAVDRLADLDAHLTALYRSAAPRS